MMGNKATGGPFAPLVVVVRNVVGEKDFNKLRGKAISLHSQGALLVCMIGPMPCEGMQPPLYRQFCAPALAHCWRQLQHATPSSDPPNSDPVAHILSLVLLLQSSRTSASCWVWTTSRCRV